MFYPLYNIYNDHQCERIGKKRGVKEYFPPYWWKGYALNILGKYGNGNNTWLGMSNINDEWYVASHGLCNENIKEKIKGIISEGIKDGVGNTYSQTVEFNNPGKTVWNGAYIVELVEYGI